MGAAGKSTLLKLDQRGFSYHAGKVVIGDTVVFGYYTQDGLKLNR